MDHLSRLELSDNEATLVHMNDSFPDEQLLPLSHTDGTPWFVDIMNYLTVGIIPMDLTSQQRKGSLLN